MSESKTILLPEGDDDRVRIAARRLLEANTCRLMLIGHQQAITDALGPGDYTVIEPDAKDSPVWQGATLVAEGKADGIVAGAATSTADVLRAYFKTIGLKKGLNRAASCFLMEKSLQRYIFTDCAVNIEPSAEVLAEIAHLAAEFAPLVGIEPKVAFLSFSTHGSATHERVDKVREASKIAKERYPDMVSDGELQFDSAIVPAVAKLKTEDSVLGGEATVMVFPDLDAGNIAYKIAERLGGFKATGPLLLGFNKPAHDLSRGCNADDIVSAVEISVKQAKVR